MQHRWGGQRLTTRGAAGVLAHVAPDAPVVHSPPVRALGRDGRVFVAERERRADPCAGQTISSRRTVFVTADQVHII